MDQFVRRMIQRPNVMGDYKNAQDHHFKDAMNKNLLMQVVEYNEMPQNAVTIDANSYQAITPGIMESINSVRSLNSKYKSLTKASPIHSVLNPIMGYSGSKKSLSVLKNGLTQTL